MNEQAIRFRIGIFVLAALILLGVLIILFGGLPNYFRAATNFIISFPNAQGIAPGTPVKRSGVKIGEVRRVTLNNDTGKVEVHILVDEGYTLRKGDRPTLLQGLLSGDAAISFLPPPDQPVDTSPVEPGSTLVGYVPADAGTLMQEAGKVMPNAQEALNEIRNVFQKIDKEVLPELKKTNNEILQFTKITGEAVPEIKKTFSRVEKDLIPDLIKTSEKIRDFADKTEKLLPDVAKTLQRIDKEVIPDFRRTNDELQVTIRNWGKVGEQADNLLQANKDKLVKTLDNMQETLKRVAEIFNDDNQKSIRDILKNVRTASDRFDGLARNADDFMKDSQGTLKRFNESLAKIEEVLANVQKATKPLADRGESIVKNIDESTDKLNRTLADVRELMQIVSRGDGTIQKLLSDPALYNNLNETSVSLSHILPRVDRILRDVEIFSDKIARHPESLGIGGVVRPGSGLKESPAPYKVMPLYP